MFKNLPFILATFLISQNAFSKDVYPQDITDFIEQRESCEHFLGEISGDPAVDLARNLAAQLDKFCKGTDHQLEVLRLKYKNDGSILEVLNAYDFVECSENCDNNTRLIMPQFTDYPVDDIVKNAVGKYSANFAGHYHVLTNGCGGGAICGEIIDIKTGKFVVSFPNAYLIEDDEGNNNFEVSYKIDSRLIIISAIAADNELDAENNVLEPTYRTRYYHFTDDQLQLLMQ